MFGIAARMIRPRSMLPNYGPLDDRMYYPGGSYYGSEVPLPIGMTGSSDFAMRLITVQNCVRLRAFTISRLPCHIMKFEGKQRATDFYLYEKLHDQPNDWMTAPEFWSMAEAHVCLAGNFYAYKLGLDNRPILQLIPIKTDAVQNVEQNNDYSLTYHTKMKDGTIQPIPGYKIMHLKGLTLDGINGANPIEYAREVIGLGMSGIEFLTKFFSKGMHPGAVIEHPLVLNAPAHANLKKNLKEKYEGLGKAYEFMLIDEGMKISFPEIKLVDAQFLEQMKLTEAQIAGLFRVPLMLINGSDKAPTFASAEQFLLFYQMFSIDVPIYESCIRRDLLTNQEKKIYYAKFEMKALQRGAFKEQMDGFGVAIDKEIYNPNEVRDILDEPRRTDPDGDVYRTRTSTVKEGNGQANQN